MKYGSMTILIRERNGTDEHTGYVESLTRMRRAGFVTVDINLCQICAHKTSLHLDSWREETDRIGETAASLGIELVQCHLPFKSAKVKWKKPDEYAYYIEMFYRAIDVAARLGIPRAVIHPERDRGAQTHTEDELLAINRREFDPLIAYALDSAVGIAFENMRGGYCSTAEQLARLVDSYADTRVGACWDTGHAHTAYGGASQADAIRTLGSRLVCTHIDDNFGDADLHLLPWEGTVNWSEVMSALRSVNYPGALILEPSVNYRSPDSLKDENARHAFEVVRRLAEEF